MSYKNPIPIVKDMPAKERNLWTGIVLVIAIWIVPAVFNFISADMDERMIELLTIFYLIVVGLLMLMFLLYTSPTNPKMYMRRRKQFILLLLIFLGYLVIGLLMVITFGDYSRFASGIVLFAPRLFDYWVIGLIIITSITFVWYLITMWHRNPAAVLFPNPIFLIKKHPNRSRKASRSHKNMKKKLGRD